MPRVSVDMIDLQWDWLRKPICAAALFTFAAPIFYQKRLQCFAIGDKTTLYLRHLRALPTFAAGVVLRYVIAHAASFLSAPNGVISRRVRCAHRTRMATKDLAFTPFERNYPVALRAIFWRCQIGVPHSRGP